MISVDMLKMVVNMSEKEILTVKDVSKYLGIHPLTVQKYARGGKIPAFKIGTDWRFHKRYIEKWIREQMSSNLKDKALKNSLFEFE